MLATTSFSVCDVNQDGQTDIVDVQRVLNEALGGQPANHDVNLDGKVNIVDVQAVVSAALHHGCLGQAGPTITDFNPKSGPAGTLVSLTGSLLLSNTGTAVSVQLPAQGGGLITAPLSTVTATSLTFVVPPGAASGLVTVSGSGTTASSAGSFTVTTSTSFSVSTSPPSASVIVGQSSTYTVSLTTTNGFAQLAQLSVTGVPAGVSAAFKPPQTTVGQQAVLTLAVPANQPTGQSNLTISASATVDGQQVTLSNTVTLNIQPVTTSFVGRTVVSDGQETSLANVKVSMLGTDGSGHSTPCTGSTFSDASGNFMLASLPAGCAGPQLVSFDGTTASAPAGKFAGVNLVYTLTVGQVTTSPVLVHLPRIDSAETFLVQQNSGTVQSYPYSTIPGLSLTVYPGTTFTMPDGSQPNPFPLAAVHVPVDRLPDLKPPVPTMINIFIVAFQPANVTANQPVAVYYPNPLNTPPATSMPLLTLDPTKGSMVPYGTGVVSNDGVTIVPDLDPSSPGHRYGIVHFDWHGPMPPPPTQIFLGGGGTYAGEDTDPLVYEPAPSPAADPTVPSAPNVGAGPRPKKGGSIDLASGLESYTATDLAINGNLGRISIDRTYLSLSTTPGPFGIGTNHGFSMRLDTNQPQGAAWLNLIMPDGGQFPFARQSDGTLTCTAVFSMSGAVMQTAVDGTATLRLKDGTVYTFVPATYPSGTGTASAALLSSVADIDGNVTTIQRDPTDPIRITSITEPGGRSLTLTYDGADRITQATDPINRQVKYTYNPAGYLWTVTDANGGVTTYAYDGQNRLQSVTDARNITTYQNQYDGTGRVKQQTFADGTTMQFSYTLANPLVAASPVLSTTVTDQLSRQTTYRFNAAGYVVTVTDPTGQIRNFDRDPQSNRLVSVSGNGVCDICGNPGFGKSSFTYDPVTGNMLTETDALNDTYTYSYDPQTTLLKSVTDPLNKTVSYTYDPAGHLLTSTNQNGSTYTNTYWPNGLLKTASDPTGATFSYTYDSEGNLTDETDPQGNVSHFRYDAVSRPVGRVDPQGNALTLVYDNLDRVTSATSGKLGTHAEDRTISMAYDAIGGVQSITDNAQHSIHFQYDPMERVKLRTDALNRSMSFTYTATGHIQTVTGRDGKVQQFHYDTLDRPDVDTYADATVSRLYDGMGRLQTVTDSQSGKFEFAYDDAGELIRSLSPFGSVVITRDHLGRVQTRQVTGQAIQALNYDPAGNLLSASMGQASVTYTYDKRNLPTQVSRSNKVSTLFGFDPMGQLTSMVSKNGSTALNTQAFQYDLAGRLLTASNDIAQPLITPAATGTYDAGNQMSAFGSTTYVNDSNGNRTSETSPTGGRTYTWDARGRLTSVVTADGRTITLVYDPAGNLISYHQTGNGADVTRTYVLDENTNVVYQGSNDPTQQFSFLMAGDLDSSFVAIDASGNPHFNIDGLVSSNIANTGASGAIDGKAYYEPYGQTTLLGNPFPAGYAGRSTIDSNLYYMRSRYYDAVSGRFLSEDPIDVLGGANLYSYVGNDPVDYSDPTGRYTGADDAALFALGALKGAGQEIASQMQHLPFQPINWKKVAAAAVGGGVGAVVSEYGTPVFGNIANAAVENAVNQLLDNLDGTQCGFNLGSFVSDTAQSALNPFAKSGWGALKLGKKAKNTKIEDWLVKGLAKLDEKFPSLGSLENKDLKRGAKTLNKIAKKIPTGGGSCK